MSISLKVESGDARVKIQREAAAQRVTSYFGLCLAESRLLCFLDDNDPSELRKIFGPTNRGLYRPIHDNTVLDGLPSDVQHCICPSDRTGRRARVVDDFVYLYGSTCDDEVGLTMTLAHELQHSIQHARTRKVWFANYLVRRLNMELLKLTWADIPIEREARIISKRVAECLFGEQQVRQYIERKIGERITEDDVADWQFINTLRPSSSVDLVGETQLLLERLRDHQPELEEILRHEKAIGNPDASGVDLNIFL